MVYKFLITSVSDGQETIPKNVLGIMPNSVIKVSCRDSGVYKGFHTVRSVSYACFPVARAQPNTLWEQHVYTLCFIMPRRCFFCFIFQALSGLMFVPSSSFSPPSSPCIPPTPQISGQLPRQTQYRLHKLSFLESKEGGWGVVFGISSTCNWKWQPLNRSGQWQ